MSRRSLAGVEMPLVATMYLIDDDAPWRFSARVVTVVRDDVRVAGKAGVVVTIDPPLDEPPT